MPVKLHDFVRDTRHGDDSIAGYLESGVGAPGDPPRFVYWRSSNAMLPAFVNCLEGGGDMRRIYTNHVPAPWARPRGPGVKRRDNLRAGDGDGSLMVEPVPMASRRWPSRVVGDGGPAPLTGGLHAALLSSTRVVGTTEGRGEHEASELTRSLRHYTLAARTLIASSATSGFAGMHDHVGAILVGDDGAILAAGINTGSYRHAEVSLLLSWFRDHPESRTLPAKSVVLTTLTPCRQCTRYLELAKAPDTLIRFDEADAGRSGRVGERIAERVPSGTDRRVGPPVAGTDILRDATSRGSSAVREAGRRSIRNGGAEGPSRMDRSREARRALLDAGDPLGRVPSRVAAGRRPGAGDGERGTEAAVLAYLTRWVLDAARAA